MTLKLKYKKFGWENITFGFVFVCIAYLLIFLIAALCYYYGLSNYYDQHQLAAWSEYNVTKRLQAYYDAQAWLLGTIYGALLALFVCLGLFAVIVIVTLIYAFEWDRY